MKLFRLSFAAAVLGVTLTACGTSSPTAPATVSGEGVSQTTTTGPDGSAIIGTGARTEPDPTGGF